MTFKQVREAFEEAEHLLKRHETRTSEGPLIPAINELRYAGYHVLREEHDKAHKHCLRAKFDTSEALSIFYLRECQDILDLQQEHQSIAVSVYNDYKDIIQRFKNLTSEFLAMEKGDSRENFHEQCLKLSEEAGELFSTLGKGHSLFHSLREQEREKEKCDLRKFRIGILSCLIITTIGILVKLYI